MTELSKLIDRNEVIDTVTRLFIETDSKNWNAVASLFTEAVHFDMTSLAGGSPVTLSGRQIADAWSTGLKDIAQVHHQAGNFTVSLDGDRAHVFCYGVATHYRPEAEKKVTSFVGSYDVELARNGGGWKIAAFKFNKKYVD